MLPIPSSSSQAFTCLLPLCIHSFSWLSSYAISILHCTHTSRTSVHRVIENTSIIFWLCGALLNCVHWYPVRSLTLTSICTTQMGSLFTLLHDDVHRRAYRPCILPAFPCALLCPHTVHIHSVHIQYSPICPCPLPSPFWVI